MPLYQEGYFGTYEPRVVREEMSLGEKHNEDKIILLSMLPEFCMVEKFKVQVPAQDMITRGLFQFSQTRKPTLGLCVTSQILLDVHHLMRRSTSSALDGLRISGLRIQKTIEEYWRLVKTHPEPKFWPKEGETEIHHIHSSVKAWIIQNRLIELRDKVDPGMMHHRPKNHALLLGHPTLCGLMLFNLNMRMQSVGQMLVTQWYDVPQIAYLYNLVARSSKHQDMHWPDMEAFIKIHGESHLFIGARPSNVIGSLNGLELAAGVSSVADFARGARKK